MTTIDSTPNIQISTGATMTTATTTTTISTTDTSSRISSSLANKTMTAAESINNHLIDIETYNPDTLDLDTDREARDYWIDCFSNVVKKFANQAARSQSTDPTAEQRAQEFQQDYINQLNQLKCGRNQNDAEQNIRCQTLTIRTLLDLNESCLKSHGFTDPWKDQKLLENSAALAAFRQRLDELDGIERNDEKWLQLFNGILAGNMFDWGAQAVTQIMENNIQFGLSDALNCIQSRPWLVDGFDGWLQRINCGEPHKCAVIFVDNSGVDVVLGVMPFARQLLLRGTRVMLCANSGPSLNDITFNELDDVVRKCCAECDVLQQSYQSKRLSVHSNGHSGPCLDVRQISMDLTAAIDDNQADLLIIEGMGRALHTNLNAKFKCETLKLAVIKNKWWANRLGGEIFSIICKYEPI